MADISSMLIDLRKRDGSMVRAQHTGSTISSDQLHNIVKQAFPRPSFDPTKLKGWPDSDGASKEREPLTYADLEQIHAELSKSAAPYVIFHPDAVADMRNALHILVAREATNVFQLAAADSILDQSSDAEVMVFFASLLQ